MPIRKGFAVWEGPFREGKGTVKVESGLFEGQYSASSRFENGPGTNPEELIGAAHAGCYSMFLSALITGGGFKPNRIHTTATVHMGAGPAIERIELACEAEVPGLDEAQFQDLAAQAKAGCPVSKALAAVPEIVLDARLVS